MAPKARRGCVCVRVRACVRACVRAFVCYTHICVQPQGFLYQQGWGGSAWREAGREEEGGGGPSACCGAL